MRESRGIRTMLLCCLLKGKVWACGEQSSRLVVPAGEAKGAESLEARVPFSKVAAVAGAGCESGLGLSAELAKQNYF